MVKKLFLIITFCCSFISLQANNIQVDNISLTGQNTVQGFTMVEFDLAWENSWRLSVGPANWDAAWVFVKYRANNGEWKHAALNYVDGNNDGHHVPSGYTVKGDNQDVFVINSCNGVFIYRSTDGSGNVNLQDIQLRWNYRSNGVANSDLVDVKVFAIEMVYVPQGAFELGSPANHDTLEFGKFFTYPNLSSPYRISSEAAITVGTANGNLYYNNYGDQAGPIPASFPKGYDAFYCMKYEMSQGQWISFFNLLTRTQQDANDVTGWSPFFSLKGTDAEVARNGVSWIPGRGDATTTNPYVPINYLSRPHMAAYLDWACLRWMSEFEFEKACRGSFPASTGENAWGSSYVYQGRYPISEAGTRNERIDTMGINIGNAIYNESFNLTHLGPLRCGIFAASANTQNRIETGGSFYGIMELSGNLEESVVVVGNSRGRIYTGNHGNGIINGAGLGTVSNWPDDFGVGQRGGAFTFGYKLLNVSGRLRADIVSFQSRSMIGFRGVRTAP